MPTFEELLAENIELRARIVALEAERRPIEEPKPPKRFKPHEMDPNAEDSFRRPAYSRRTK